MKIKISLFLAVFFSVFFCACSIKEEPLNLNNRNRTIVAFGDSLTEGQGVDRADSYPAVLENILGRTVVNLGISGNVSAQGLARVNEIDEYRPYMVLIEFGANDAMRGIPFESTKNNLTQIVDYVQARGAVAVLIDTGGAFQMNRYSGFMKDLAKQKRALFVPGIMDGIFTNTSLKSDTLHPNEKGYQMIAERVAAVIKPFI